MTRKSKANTKEKALVAALDIVREAAHATEPPTTAPAPAPEAPEPPLIEPLWQTRLEKMAAATGRTPKQYLETLLARAWTAMPLSKRGP